MLRQKKEKWKREKKNKEKEAYQVWLVGKEDISYPENETTL